MSRRHNKAAKLPKVGAWCATGTDAPETTLQMQAFMCTWNVHSSHEWSGSRWSSHPFPSLSGDPSAQSDPARGHFADTIIRLDEYCKAAAECACPCVISRVTRGAQTLPGLASYPHNCKATYSHLRCLSEQQLSCHSAHLDDVAEASGLHAAGHVHGVPCSTGASTVHLACGTSSGTVELHSES